MSGPPSEKYDALILDCPPGISLLLENVLRAADAVIIPMLPIARASDIPRCSQIKYASEIERMTLRRAPLPAYAPKSVEEQAHSALWSEISARIGIEARAVEPTRADESATPLVIS